MALCCHVSSNRTVQTILPLCHIKLYLVCFHRAGSSFSAEDLSCLHLGDMKTKMLLSSLTKLGKLRVQVDSGQIIGYCLHGESDC